MLFLIINFTRFSTHKISFSLVLFVLVELDQKINSIIKLFKFPSPNHLIKKSLEFVTIIGVINCHCSFNLRPKTFNSIRRFIFRGTITLHFLVYDSMFVIEFKSVVASPKIGVNSGSFFNIFQNDLSQSFFCTIFNQYSSGLTGYPFIKSENPNMFLFTINISSCKNWLIYLYSSLKFT